MRVLDAAPRLFVYALAVLAIAHLAPQSQAHPPHSPGHGVNETTACTLWAGDADATNTTDLENNTAEPPSGYCALAPMTDIPLDSPPRAVETWNDGDVASFPNTGAGRSLYPRTATVSDGAFIADAYTEIAAVQPSTRARLSPSDQPLYVAPNGTLLGVLDYRVDTAATADDVASIAVLSHEVTEVRFLIDGRVVERTTGDRTPTFDYDLRGDVTSNHTLGIEADVSTEIERRREQCTGLGGSATCSISTDRETETLTVSDSVDVVPYDLSVGGYRARYPNGDLGLVVYKNHPWLGHSLPTGDVRGIWRFYATQDPDWMAVVEATERGQTVRHSPVHPLQVTAYPIEAGPTPSPRRTVTLLEAYGDRTASPTLPANVSLDVQQDAYTASYGIATRTNTTDHDFAAIQASGLVRGVEADPGRDAFVEIPINRTNLTISVVDRNPDATTVRVDLHDAETGDPIETQGRRGFVVLQNQRVNTSDNGTVTTTLRQPVGGVTARFEPGPWWLTPSGYVSDSDIVAVSGGALAMVAVLYDIAIPVGLFLLGVFIIDRFTGWRIWPPWRGLS